MDADGQIVLEVIDHRGIVIKDSTRALLGPILTDLSTDPPRLTEYNDVIGVLAGRLGISLPPANVTTYDDGSDPTGGGAGANGLDDGGIAGDAAARTPVPNQLADASPESTSTDQPPSSSGITPITIALAALALLGVVLAIAAMRRGRRHDQLADIAFSDGLTGLNNRRRFDSDLAAHARLRNQPTAVLMLDVDHFKRFNDTHGHAVGDEVLRKVGEVIARNVRSNDVAYRYGGEEFSVLLPDSTVDDAHAVGLRLNHAIQKIRIETAAGDDASVTASLGLAYGPSEHVMHLVEQADQALYSAKRAGRNRLVMS